MFLTVHCCLAYYGCVIEGMMENVLGSGSRQQVPRPWGGGNNLNTRGDGAQIKPTLAKGEPQWMSLMDTVYQGIGTVWCCALHVVATRGVLARLARVGHLFFLPFPRAGFCPPPPHQTICPQERRGNVAAFNFDPSIGDPREGRAYVANLPILRPLPSRRVCIALKRCAL